MKRQPLLKIFLTVMLTAIVLFTVTVREVHYIFWEHEKNEHCENHLHTADEHSDCAVCKFDVLFFTDAIFAPENTAVIFIEEKPLCRLPAFSLQSSLFNLSLRGPPALV